MAQKQKQSHLALRALTEGAIMLALAQLLSMLRLFRLPQGGSITLTMLPIFLYCARWGFGPGILVSFAFGLLHMFIDGGQAWGWQSILGDYLVAYTVLGFAGLFHKQKLGFFWGTILGCILRFLCSFVTGALVYGDAMPDTFFGMTMTSPWIYSGLYNGSYMLACMLLILLVGALLWKPMGKYFRGEDLKR